MWDTIGPNVISGLQTYKSESEAADDIQSYLDSATAEQGDYVVPVGQPSPLSYVLKTFDYQPDVHGRGVNAILVTAAYKGQIVTQSADLRHYEKRDLKKTKNIINLWRKK